MSKTSPTLDGWLAALYRGEFGELDPPFERAASWLLSRGPGHPATPAYKRYLAQRDRIHRTWPILCRSCGTEFSPGRRAIRRCPACRRGGAAHG